MIVSGQRRARWDQRAYNNASAARQIMERG